MLNDIIPLTLIVYDRGFDVSDLNKSLIPSLTILTTE